MLVSAQKAPYSILDLLSAVLQKGSGREEEFERLFAERFGFNYGLFFNYGRSALFSLITGLGWKNEEMVIPAYICSVVANAIVLSGNKVRFADNEADHFLVPAENLSKAVSRKTKLIIPLPLFGFPIDRVGYEKVIAAQAPEAFVLYDCAQAFDVRDAEGLQTSRANGAFFGLSEGKTLSSIFGGMLLLRDEKLYQSIKDFRDKTFHPPTLSKSLKNFMYGLGYYWAYRYPCIYLFSYLKDNTTLLDNLKNPKAAPTLPRDASMRPTRLQAKLGIKQLCVLDKIVAQRRKNAALYKSLFSETGVMHFHHERCDPGTHFPLLTKNRERAISILRKRRVNATYPFSHACSDLPGFDEHHGGYPHATDMAGKLIMLPCWPGMSTKQIARVADAVIDSRKQYPEVF